MEISLGHDSSTGSFGDTPSSDDLFVLQTVAYHPSPWNGSTEPHDKRLNDDNN
jgi:hypothetical protein